MNRRKLNQFFRELAKRHSGTLRLIITGGVAALLQGGRRVTQDIDFQIVLPSPSGPRARGGESIESILDKASRSTGVAIQYSEDVGRWSSIAIPPRRPRGSIYRVLGKLTIEIMHPLPWSLGKMARALESDLDDISVVFGNQRIHAKQAVRYWARALSFSPRSSAQDLFRRQAEDFLVTRGPRIKGWKRRSQDWVRDFNKALAKG